MPKISIIIATYNRGERLLRTLQSLAGQTLAASEWEAIVVNNNSTDSTARVFADFAAEHEGLNLRIVDEPAQGLSHARNRGITEARGELIAIIDDDEEVNPQFAENYLDFFERHPEALITGGKIVPKYESDRPRWMSRWTERPIAGPLDLGPREKPFRRGYPGGGNLALRRGAFEKYGVFDVSLGRTGSGSQALLGGEEKELVHRVISASGLPAWWVPGAVVHHIIAPEKLTRDYFERLSRGVGVSERVRTQALGGRAYAFAKIKEGGKWIATLPIALFFALTARPSKALYLIIMRYNISKGLL